MKVIVLIGEMGVGKSRLGRAIASHEEMGFEFVEGDDLAGPEMAQAIKDLRRITYDMVDDLVERMANHLWKRKIEGCKGAVLSQALYRKRHRDNLRYLLERAGINVSFVWVKPRLLQHVRQLLSRDKGWRWVLYWLLSKPFFERPKKMIVFRNEKQLKEMS